MLRAKYPLLSENGSAVVAAAISDGADEMITAIVMILMITTIIMMMTMTTIMVITLMITAMTVTTTTTTR